MYRHVREVGDLFVDVGDDRAPSSHARDKATGATVYTADVDRPGMCHAALVRSVHHHAVIEAVDFTEAASLPGVIGVYTAADMTGRPYGRRVRDMPILVGDKARFIGDRIAVVVAERRDQAEQAAQHVDVHYRPLPAVLDVRQALADGAPLVHEAPWEYSNAVIGPDQGRNLQTHICQGALAAVERQIAAADFVVEQTYATPTGHQGYIEPQACLVEIDDGVVHVWATDKSPYRVREELAHSLRLDLDRIVVHQTAVGGDFGGKGGFGEVFLCAELARITGRPVRLALRYSEDLVATNPRHPASITVRIACDAGGHLMALAVDALVDGGAYAAFKPRPQAALSGIPAAGSSYRIPHAAWRTRIVYTNSVPRGHMRAPGAPQAVFAIESALDELAALAGIDSVQIRQINLLGDGDANPQGITWVESRGHQTLDAALEVAEHALPAPPGWRPGRGIAAYDRATHGFGRTSLRLVQLERGGFRVELPVPDTGAGTDAVVREPLAVGLGVDAGRIEVVHGSTRDLPYDFGAVGSRLTLNLTRAVDRALAAWDTRGDEDSVVVEVEEYDGPAVTSFCVQIAHVAVDPLTGEVRVLQLTTAVDVADIMNPVSHGMQLDGGSVMGYGFACLEDLQIEDGQVWAANLGEFRLPSIRDIPRLRTVLVEGGVGLGPYNVKGIGEITNVPTAAAIANAVADATGVRVRRLPIRADEVWAALQHGSPAPVPSRDGPMPDDEGGE